MYVSFHTHDEKEYSYFKLTMGHHQIIKDISKDIGKAINRVIRMEAAV